MNAHGSANARANSARADFRMIAALVEPGSKVLDIGCGDGLLLRLLEEERAVDGRGIEISQEGVNRCVANGLSVVQGDADRDLVDYPDNSFDYVVLSQTIQATHQPRAVLSHLLRIGKRAIVTLPNFGHWRVRLQLLVRGRMPITGKLPYSWYNTPNIHFCTIRDFVELTGDMGVRVQHKVVFDTTGHRLPEGLPLGLQNILGDQALFLLSRD